MLGQLPAASLPTQSRAASGALSGLFCQHLACSHRGDTNYLCHSFLGRRRCMASSAGTIHQGLRGAEGCHSDGEGRVLRVAEDSCLAKSPLSSGSRPLRGEEEAFQGQALGP